MSLRVSVWAYKQTQVGPHARLVLLILPEHGYDDGSGEISWQRLLGLTSLDASELMIALDDLVAARLIVVLRGATPFNSESLPFALTIEPPPEDPPRAATSRARKIIPRALRTSVFERDGYRCQAPGCGSWEDLQADHIHPESKGGPTTLENLQTLCRPCNMRKGAKVV